MKKQRLLKLVALFVLCCMLFGCKKETIVYGTVFRSDGNPAGNVQVTLEYAYYRINSASGTDYAVINSAITGADGQYEIVFQYNSDIANSHNSNGLKYEGYYLRLGSATTWGTNRTHIEIKAGGMNRIDLRY